MSQIGDLICEKYQRRNLELLSMMTWLAIFLPPSPKTRSLAVITSQAEIENTERLGAHV